MEHKFQEIQVRRVALVPHPSLPDDKPYVLGLTDFEAGVGCETCGMGMDEALSKPCPGVGAKAEVTIP